MKDILDREIFVGDQLVVVSGNSRHGRAAYVSNDLVVVEFSWKHVKSTRQEVVKNRADLVLLREIIE